MPLKTEPPGHHVFVRETFLGSLLSELKVIEFVCENNPLSMESKFKLISISLPDPGPRLLENSSIT